MKKINLKILLFAVLLLTVVQLTIRSHSYGQAYTENFNDITLLSSSGWHIQNNSSPIGSISWFQGTATTASPIPGPFNAYNGADNAYIGVNFNSTGSTGTISNWLLTPNRTLRNGDVFTFYTRKPTISSGSTDYPDRLEVRLSTDGASTNVGSGASGFGDFSTLLLSINPTLITGVYPQVWTQYTITISGLAAPTSGRLAFRYFVTDAGSLGTKSDYIGIDNVVYTPYVCPTFTMTAGGPLDAGAAGVAYTYLLTQTGALGAPTYTLTAGALPPGLTLAANGTISGTPTATGTFNFTATVNDASGCSGSQSYSITISCPTNSIIFEPMSICANATPITLTATPAGGEFTGTGVSDDTFDPAAGTQTITYTYTDPYGCSYSSNATFTVKPIATGIDVQNICVGESYTFNDMVYTSSNFTALDTFISSEGCDSVVTLNLNVTLNGIILASTTKNLSDTGLNHIITDENCELMTAVSFDNPVGEITATVNVAVPQSESGDPFVSRVYDIHLENNSSGLVAFYYTQAEFDAYNDLVGIDNPDYPQINALANNLSMTIFHSDAGSGIGILGYDTTASTIEVMPCTAIWNDFVDAWEVTIMTSAFSGFALHTKTDATPLPITLLNINASNIGNSNHIDWTIAAEMEEKMYTIERSHNGRSFENIGMVNANKNNNGNYKFIDTDPLKGVNFYRLQMMDINGTKAYSKIVQANAQIAAQIVLSPNPVTDDLKMSIKGNMEANATILLSDVTGKIIQNITTNEKELVISMNHLAQGVYFVIYKDAQNSQTFKVVKN